MANPVKINDANSKQVANYLRVSLNGEAAIEDSIALAAALKVLTPDRHEKLSLNKMIAELEINRARVSAERLAFLNELNAIKPPTKSDVKKMVALARTIDEQTANNIKVSAILSSATAVVNLWEQTVA